MRCPYCSHEETQVAETRDSDEGFTRRRRRCLKCDRRFTTYERPEVAMPTVVKRDGGRVEFDPAKLQHPNVVAVFDVEQDQGTYYYAMELMQGSLESWLKKNGKMPPERALQAIAEAASGLAYAESLKIVHRDIKPDNLMLDQHDTVKIADLGLARSEEGNEEHHAGTPHFMSPEQVLRKPLDHRSDLYSLGCTFYRLVTGRTPFRGQSVKDILRAQVKDEAEPAHKVESGVPTEVSAIIQKLMQKEPANRYQSATELLDALQLLLQPPAKKGLWIGLAAAAVLVAGGSIYYAVTKPKEVVEVEKKYDDPEKQLFADQLKELRAQKKQDDAQIALLRTQVRGLAGDALATALDEVAAAHPGTKAAEEAKGLAKTSREASAAQAAASAQKTQATDAAIAALAQQVDQRLTAGDPVAALAVVAKAAPPSGVDETAYADGAKRQRQRVLTFAADRLQQVERALQTARSNHDTKAIDTVTADLQKILAKDGGWPGELFADRTATESLLANAQRSRTEVETTATNEQWQKLDSLLRDPNQVSSALAAYDFGRAANAVQGVAEKLGTAPAAVHGTKLAAALQHAGVFADALSTALGGGKLTLAGLSDTPTAVVRWQRDANALVVLDASKKPAKEQSLPLSKLSLEQWNGLAAQVQGAPEGSRECFLTFVAISTHAQRAGTFLGALQKDKDDSGTGAAGYPLSTALLDQVLRTLPAGDVPWNAGIRAELAAGRLLVAGLRAISERRNLAAAVQLERLLGEHPHSLAVALVP